MKKLVSIEWGEDVMHDIEKFGHCFEDGFLGSTNHGCSYYLLNNDGKDIREVIDDIHLESTTINKNDCQGWSDEYSDEEVEEFFKENNGKKFRVIDPQTDDVGCGMIEIENDEIKLSIVSINKYGDSLLNILEDGTFEVVEGLNDYIIW